MKQVSCVGHKYNVPWQPAACDLCTPSLAVDIQEDGNLQNDVLTFHSIVCFFHVSFQDN